MKKLLFPIYSHFFFLWTLDVGNEDCSRGGHRGGGRAVRRRGAGQGWGAPVDEVCWQPAWWRRGQAAAGRLGNSKLLPPTGLGAGNGEARRVKAAVAGYGPTVAGSGGQSSLRKEEERSMVAIACWRTKKHPTAWLGTSSWQQMGKGEGESGEEGAGPGLKHAKVAARSAQASHAARAACTVTILFRNFKFSILPQTYHWNPYFVPP